jgi:TnpA family transposase
LFGAADVSTSDVQHFPTAAQGGAVRAHNARHGHVPSVLFYTHHSARYAPFHTKAIPPTTAPSTTAMTAGRTGTAITDAAPRLGRVVHRPGLGLHSRAVWTLRP